MKTFASALVIIAALAVNLISDIIIEPRDKELAAGWNWTALVIIVIGIYGFIKTINDKDNS